MLVRILLSLKIDSQSKKDETVIWRPHSVLQLDPETLAKKVTSKSAEEISFAVRPIWDKKTKRNGDVGD